MASTLPVIPPAPRPAHSRTHLQNNCCRGRQQLPRRQGRRHGDAAKADAQGRAAARRAFWQAKRQAKAAGVIDQFEADCTRRWKAARYGTAPVVEATGRAGGERAGSEEIEDNEEDFDWSDIN